MLPKFVYLKKSLKQIATIFSVQPKIPLAAQLRRIGMYETLRLNNWILDVKKLAILMHLRVHQKLIKSKYDI